METTNKKGNNHEPAISISLDDIYLFKVSDYTTILLGRFDEAKKCFYVQRGDGKKYEYDEYRITWKEKLKFL